MANEVADDPDATRHCMRHPRVETLVSCAGCGGPICTKCMITTPVGYKCRNCTQLRRAPQYTLSKGCAWLVRLLPELAAGPIEPLPPWTCLAPTSRRPVWLRSTRRWRAC